MKIGILGGTFNPPHWGHQLMTQQSLEFTDLEEIWLTPCYKHTFEKKLAPAEHRLNMTRFITNSHIKICDEEMKKQLSGQTIELMKLLSKNYPQHEFSFIIGSDNLISFKKWGCWQELVSTWPFLVFPRPEFEPNLAKYGLDKSEYKFKIIKNPLLVTSNISSTIVRQRFEQGLETTNLICQKVKQYIIKQKLYK